MPVKYDRFIHEIVEALRLGYDENLYHTLMEAECAAVPTIIAAARTERDAAVREILAQSLLNHRHPSVVAYFGELLFDTDPRLWKAALDGLVANAAIDALRVGRDRVFEDAKVQQEFRLWLEEAIEQAEEAARGE